MGRLETILEIGNTFSIFTLERLFWRTCHRCATWLSLLNTSTFTWTEFETRRTINGSRTIFDWLSARIIWDAFYWSLWWTIRDWGAVFKAGSARSICKTMERKSLMLWACWKNYFLCNQCVDSLGTLFILFRIDTRFVPTLYESDRTWWSWGALGRRICAGYKVTCTQQHS